MSANANPLQERIARELFLCERWNFRDGRPDREKTPEGDRAERERMAALWDAEAGKPWHESEWPSFRQTYPRLAAAVLPIVAEEVRKAKADAWDEGYLDRSPYGGRARSRAGNPYRSTEQETRRDDQR